MPNNIKTWECPCCAAINAGEVGRCKFCGVDEMVDYSDIDYGDSHDFENCDED